MSQNSQSLSPPVLRCKRELAASVVTRRFHGASYMYIRRDGLNEATKESRIAAVVHADGLVPANPPHLRLQWIQQIANHGKVMFAICMHESLDLAFLRSLLNSGKSDAKLPLSQNVRSQNPSPEMGIFLRSQWLLNQPPTFNIDQFARILPDTSLIPINFEDDESVGSGAEGKVVKVRIDAQYFDFGDQLQHGNTNTVGLSRQLALKIIPIRNQNRRERDFLTHLANSHIMPHNHITRTYTGFEFRGNDYFLSELASTDLQKLMFEYANAKAAGFNHDWIRKQFIGLVSALAKIHGPTATGRTAYHHDIKPSNVLVFPDRTLKLTDWGCAGFRPMLTPGQSQGTFKQGEFPHLPPEHVGLGARTSRPHDIWSLACVFLEVLVWFHKGPQAAYEMKRTTIAQDNTVPHRRCWFYKNTGPTANTSQNLADRFMLAPTINDALVELRTRGPIMTRLEVILRGMFAIRPGATYRSTAREVLQQLESMPVEWR